MNAVPKFFQFLEMDETNPDLSRKRRGNFSINVLTVIYILLGILNFYIAFQSRKLSTYILAGFLVCAIISNIVAARFVRKGNLSAGMFLALGAFQFLLLSASFTLSNIGAPAAFIIIIGSISLSALSMEQKHVSWALGSSLVVGYLAVTLNVLNFKIASFEPFYHPWLVYATYIFLALLLVVFILLIIARVINYFLRLKILTALLVLLLLPLIISAVLGIQFTRTSVQDSANQSLSLAAAQTSLELDNFIQTNLYSIVAEASLTSFNNYLNLPAANRSGSPEETSARLTLETLANKDRLNILSYALLDSNGEVLMSTNPVETGTSEQNRSYFNIPKQNFQQFISPMEFDPTTGRPQLIFSSPVFATQQTINGILRARYSADILTTILNHTRDSVFTGSHAVLLDENNIILVEPNKPSVMYKTITPLAPVNVTKLIDGYRLPPLPTNQLSNNFLNFSQALTQTSGSQYINADLYNEGLIYTGAISSLRNQTWKVAFIQSQELIIAPVNTQSRNIYLFVSFIGLISSLSALIIANNLTTPITQLTTAAQHISSGNLDVSAKISTRDEIEVLARAFNSMTAQLRSLITGLEDRVKQRTELLEIQTQKITYRARQLETLSEVARAIASAQDIEELLFRVTRLTSDRFNFYHVGIFLVDSNGEFAVLRAANSEGGQKMLARNHRLQVGQTGIVGYVTSAGQPRIALDVGQDAVFFNNPDLPMTRSEMALPLKSGSQIIGALDVQSTAPGAFSDEDVTLFGTLADQISIAIINSRLLTETSQALLESRDIHRQYLQQEWTREFSERQYRAYQYTPRGITPIQARITPEIARVISDGEVVISKPSAEINPDQKSTALIVPIKLREEIIGVIDLRDFNPTRIWYPEEIALVKSVADQIATAMENARLFEQTIRRANRERKVLEITSKIRSTNDPQLMLQTAVTELQQVLKANRTQIILQTVDHSESVAAGANNGHGSVHPDVSNENQA
jgi:GAF domain-containing protein/HAMP domain-containing protein